MSAPPPAFETADEVARGVATLYGDVDLGAATGVIHVTAVWDPDGERRVTLKINADTPRSPHDFFVLNLARARADAIIVTGKMLRDEPRLRYDLQGDAARGLHAWREKVLGKRQPPTILVLTSGRGLDLAHPTFHSWARPLVYTSVDAAVSLAEAAAGARVDVVGAEATGLRGAIAHLRELGAATITIEAGPSTSVGLYDEPLEVDELMLSVFHGATIPDTVVGRPFLPRTEIERLFHTTASPAPIEEQTGPWSFARYLRAPA